MRSLSLIMPAVAAIALSGCGFRTSSLLLERHAQGPLAESSAISHQVDWKLEPATLQTQVQKNIEVSVLFESRKFLNEFFNNRDVFGGFAGVNPYFPENIVFYVKVVNKSPQRVLITPMDFVLVDDHGNQYAPINEDYVNAIAEAKAPVAVVTRGMLEDAHPGYFGVGLPVGRLINTKPQGRFALIKKSSLQSAALYSDVTYDGLVAFWSPSVKATGLKLLVTNVKTDFDANGKPQTSLEFPFAFQIKNANAAVTP